MVEVTRTLAKFVAESRPAQMPDVVAQEGLRAFVNWLGCVIGGCQDEAVDYAVAAMQPFSGPAQATVIGRQLKMDVHSAAALNGLSNCIHSYNDTHMPTVAHPTGPVAAALFALAEFRPMSGEQFVHALMLGIEVECRLANMLAAPPAHCHDGLSTLGVTAPFGAAVAAGCVLGLNEQQMVWALGLAASFASGVRSTHASMASLLLPGHGARTGLAAALLAERGFTAAERSLESPTGYAAVFADPPHLAAIADGLGESWEALKNAYKPYPCGVVIHPAIDACLAAAEADGFDAGDIDKIELWLHPLAVKLTNRPEPRRRMDAIVSLQHWAAAALLHRKAGLAEASEACVTGEAETALRRKVVMHSDATVAAEAARVLIVTRSGREIRASIDACRGSQSRPMSDVELEDKFRDQSVPVLGTKATDRLLGDCWKLRDYANVGDLAAHLT